LKGNNTFDLEGFPWDDRYTSGGERPAMKPSVVVPAVREPEAGTTPEDDREIRAAKEQFDRIESVLQELDHDGQRPEAVFQVPLGKVLEWVPERYLTRAASDVSPDHPVAIVVPDLFEQLSRGCVTVDIATLVLDVPPGCVTSEAYKDSVGSVTLPLDVVVSAMDPDLLIRRTCSMPLDVDLETIPNPFVEPEAETDEADSAEEADPIDMRTAPLVSDPPPATLAETGESELPGVQVRVDYARPNIRPEEQAPPPEPDDKATEWIDAEAELEDRLGGVNINAADEKQLQTIETITPALAAGIVAYRREHGAFRSLFDLRNVPRIGRIRFKSITGMPYSTRGRHRIRKLVKLLELMPAEAYRLPSIAARVSAKPGFAGCVISGEDGLLLAQNGVPQHATAMAAVIPRLFAQVDGNLVEIGSDEAASSITICVQDRMLTIVRGRQVYLTVVHDRRKLTKGELTFARRVTEELGWLLSRRAYAGRPDSASPGQALPVAGGSVEA